jgi:hypothetical protein
VDVVALARRYLVPVGTVVISGSLITEALPLSSTCPGEADVIVYGVVVTCKILVANPFVDNTPDIAGDADQLGVAPPINTVPDAPTANLAGMDPEDE